MAGPLARGVQPVAGVLLDRVQQPVPREPVDLRVERDQRLVDQRGQQVEDLARPGSPRRRRPARPCPGSTRRTPRAGAAAPARARSAARSSSPRPPAASAAGPGPCGRRRPAAGTGRRAGPRSAPRTGRRPGPRPARWPAACRPGSGTAAPPRRCCRAPSVNPGRTAAARSANSRIASCWARSPASSSSAAGGSASGGTRHTVSPRTRSGSRLVVDHAQLRAARRAAAGPAPRMASTTCSQVSRISSSRRGRSASVSGLGQRPVRLLPDPERGRDPPGDQGRVLGVGQLDQPGAVGEAGDDLAGQPEREPGLADAARARTGSARGRR